MNCTNLNHTEICDKNIACASLRSVQLIRAGTRVINSISSCIIAISLFCSFFSVPQTITLSDSRSMSNGSDKVSLFLFPVSFLLRLIVLRALEACVHCVFMKRVVRSLCMYVRIGI